VAQFRVLPGHLDAMLAETSSLRPLLKKQKGFVALVVLRLDQPAAAPGSKSAPVQAPQEGDEVHVTTVSLWESLEDLRASEKNMFLYQAIARLMKHARGFPSIREAEVLYNDFAGVLERTADD
jgi:heme-degrading monooxygenase HmoA